MTKTYPLSVLDEKPAEPVAYKVRGLQCGTCGAWSDHRVSPDPRIAALEGLLRDAANAFVWRQIEDQLRERIEAALGKEG